ncbi:MAG: alternative ribosome rescue aminoacyl-tRNA hydrolase ArfB [Candidatus Nanopelagicales bacterium]
MDEDLVVRSGVSIPAHELRWRFSRACGPGGQGVNTTDSRVQVTFDLEASPSIPEMLRQRALKRLGDRLHDGCLTITAADSRSQWQNRRAALNRLADTLRDAMAAPPKHRRATRPSRAARERRIKGKKERGEVKRLRRSIED